MPTTGLGRVKGGKKANLFYSVGDMDILSAQEARDTQQLWAQRGCALEVTRVKREEAGDLSQTEKERGNPIVRYPNPGEPSILRGSGLQCKTQFLLVLAKKLVL